MSESVETNPLTPSTASESMSILHESRNIDRPTVVATQLLMRFPNFEVRLKRLIDVYLNYRYGLIPIMFTGSLQDLRAIVNNVDDRSSVSIMTKDLTTFTDAEYNQWCRMYQEYWLIMLQAMKEFREHKLPSYAVTLCRDSYLSLDLLMNIFEKDTTANMKRDNMLAVQLFQRMTFENQYLSKRIVERMTEQTN